jgi:hypothetical protein
MARRSRKLIKLKLIWTEQWNKLEPFNLNIRGKLTTESPPNVMWNYVTVNAASGIAVLEYLHVEMDENTNYNIGVTVGPDSTHITGTNDEVIIWHDLKNLGWTDEDIIDPFLHLDKWGSSANV